MTLRYELEHIIKAFDEADKKHKRTVTLESPHRFEQANRILKWANESFSEIGFNELVPKEQRDE